MRSHSILRPLCLVASLASLAVATNASAQKPPAPLSQSLPPAAKTDYETGKALLADGDSLSALVKFDAAYTKAKDPRLLWNMAVCEKNLRHYAKVITLLKRYEQEGATLLSSKDVQEAEDLVWALKALVATLKLDVNEAGASVYVDDELVGKTPLENPLVVDIGTRKVRVEKEGFTTFSKTLTVGGETPIVVKLEKPMHEGRLAVIAHAGDSIAIDGKQVGTGRWEGPLRSGGHTLHVTGKGMRPYDSEVGIQDNETRSLTVTLEEEKKGGGIPTWLFITAGSVAVAGLAVGGYFLFRPSAEQPSGPSGTFDPGQAIAGFRH
ncbi:MAG: hypothetical protein JWM74_4382 [Myxococcaceae bacterium]|nr:hypothetical protein [Myxococcaceae bacterium]